MLNLKLNTFYLNLFVIVIKQSLDSFINSSLINMLSVTNCAHSRPIEIYFYEHAWFCSHRFLPSTRLLSWKYSPQYWKININKIFLQLMSGF